MFEFFNLSANVYARRVQTMLREARFAQLEHAAAAEHHQALARMYAERVARLEGASNPEAVHPEKTPAAAPAPTTAGLEHPRGERPPFRVLTQTPPGAQAQA
ncbi:MAG: hypothetical protein PHU77_00735 [Simplicispira sp.]|nr:hypothetical protein [Simplicispira sp.]